MNILWVSNYSLPEICEKVGCVAIQNEGWKITISEQIRENKHNLTIMFPSSNHSNVESGEVNGLNYFLFPIESDLHKRMVNVNIEKEHIKTFLAQNNFDVIHIWGTEFPHSKATLCAAQELNIMDKTVVSIQGIVRECGVHYYSGVDIEYIKKQCPVDILRNTSIYLSAKSMIKRGDFEDDVFRMARNVIGRTEFDCNYLKLLNPQCHYYKCNETLRRCFYSGEWKYEKCTPHTIFMSQATYPLKGLHYVLKAIGLVKQYYPDVRLVIAGGDILQLREKKSLLRKIVAKHAYPEYLETIIQKFSLYENIECLGVQNAEQMKTNLLKSNMYLLASNIENSPNSLGEAMLLGLPCVASYVGGVPSICTNKEDALLYQHDDYFMLAMNIINLFNSKDLQENLSKNASIKAHKIHNMESNYTDLINIYQNIAAV